jgi:tRNA pseudouridine55 synthase
VSVLVVDKPSGPSSFAVLKRVGRALVRTHGVGPRTPKLGHGGTLDPMASGVLPVCVGEATKITSFLLNADKEYLATLCLGVETDTQDATGTVISQKPVPALDVPTLESALSTLRGEIEQVPPMFSALKHQGRPLYKYARTGQTIERPARRVTIHELVLVAFEPPALLRLRVRCTKGTYIRTLAADLGAKLGVGAHLTELRRIVSGPFHLQQALTPEEIESKIDQGHDLPYVSLREALAHMPAVQVDDALALRLSRGQHVAWAELGADSATPGPICVLRASGSLIAVVARGEEERLRSLRVFNVG